jgi:hypothetical protein
MSGPQIRDKHPPLRMYILKGRYVYVYRSGKEVVLQDGARRDYPAALVACGRIMAADAPAATVGQLIAPVRARGVTTPGGAHQEE